MSVIVNYPFKEKLLFPSFRNWWKKKDLDSEPDMVLYTPHTHYVNKL